MTQEQLSKGNNLKDKIKELESILERAKTINRIEAINRGGVITIKEEGYLKSWFDTSKKYLIITIESELEKVKKEFDSL